MHITPRSFARRLPLLTTLAATLLVAGCATNPLDTGKAERTLERARIAPQQAPVRTITDFADGLRCMDTLFLAFNTRDLSLIAEELNDNTKKVSAGTRDMLFSSLSDMTRRSRALRVVTFGSDANNLAAFLSNAQQRGAFGALPQYSLRGSITQLDEGVIKQQADAGFSLGSFFSGGKSRSLQFNVLGLDLSVASTADFALVPGANARNTVVIRKSGDALDTAATIRKSGLNFSSSFDRTDGTAQALRNVVELSSIELMGKLAKLPYWQCLGLPADSAEVRREVEDWYFAMRRTPELTAYVQEQLRGRGFFEGAVDGRATPALGQAVAAYRERLGLPAVPASTAGEIDLAFFDALLNRPAPPAPAQPFADLTFRVPELKLEHRTRRTARGVEVDLTVSASENAFVYCYAQDAGGKLQRIFPNRVARDPLLRAGQSISIPGRSGLRLTMGAQGTQYACLGAPREVYAQLPPQLRWPDFTDVGLPTIDAVGQAFSTAARQPVAIASVSVEPVRTAAR